MIRVFVSYSHEDHEWVETPEGSPNKALVPWLAHQLADLDLGVTVWWDSALRRQNAGEEFKTRILTEIDRSDFALLLLSNDFVTSPFIRTVELPRIRERLLAGRLQIIPILVAPMRSGWNADATWLQERQIIPGKPTPLISYRSDPAALKAVKLEVASAIAERIRSWRADRGASPVSATGTPPPPEFPAGTLRTIEVPGLPPFEMRWCPPGRYLRGATDGTSEERPVHEVVLTRGFWMATTPVTQDLWAAVANSNPSVHEGPRHPVDTVSFADAQEGFIPALRYRSGLPFRLPTEAEWEYAARAGSQTRWHFGNDERALAQHAWYAANAADTTHPVGKLAPNAWGLHDMYGNVWEWCSDRLGKYPATQAIDPPGAPAGTAYIRRGGGYLNEAQHCRSSFRASGPATQRLAFTGFRLVCSA